MNKIWLVAWREYRERVTRAPFLVSTGIILMMILALPLIPFFFGAAGVVKPARILIIDRTGAAVFGELQTALQAQESEAAKDLPAPLTGPRRLLEAVPAEQERAAQARVKAGDAAALVVISGPWPNAVQLEFRAATLFAMDHGSILKAALSRAAQNDRAARSGVSPEVLQQVLAPVTVSTVNLASGDRDPLHDGIRYGLAMMSGMLVYLGILMSGSMLFQGVLEEKTSRVVEVLAASVRPVQMMAGKIMGLGLLGLTQYASWVVGWLFLMTVGRSTLGDSVTMATPLFMLFLLLFTVLGYLMYAAMFAAAASTLSRIEDSATVMMPVIMPLMVPMMFGGFIIQNPEGTLARVLSLVPLFAPSVMLPRIVMGHPAAWELLLSIFLLLASGIGVTWAAGRIYRAGLLTYGGRPTLAQVWRYLRS